MTADRTAAALSRESMAAVELLADLARDDSDLGLDADFAHDVIEGETNLIEAIEAAIREIDECEIIAEGCRAKAAEVVRRRARAEARAERVRAMIERAMLLADLPTAKLPTATVTLKRLPPRPVVTDESAIPAEFWLPQPPKLDKAAVVAAAKDHPVPGTEFNNGGIALQIRRS